MTAEDDRAWDHALARLPALLKRLQLWRDVGLPLDVTPQEEYDETWVRLVEDPDDQTT